MAQWNHTDRTLVAKLVYYGPALGGKTTNLQQIHRITDPAGDTRLISLDTSGDRTLFFDLLPFDLGRLFGYSIKVQLYTVPGQVRYNATRRVVLSGADGVVFVADSSPGKGAENRGAWENLAANMKALGLDPAKAPIVVQHNKQDLPGALPGRRIEADLRSGLPGIPACAITGQGVIETFQAALQAIVRRLSEGARGGRADPQAFVDHVARVLAPYLAVVPPSSGAAATPAGAVASVTGASSVPARPGAPAEGSAAPARPAAASRASAPAPPGPSEHDPEALLLRSLDANLSIASDYSQMRELKNRLAARVREMEALHASVRELNETRDERRVIERVAKAAAEVPGVTGASVLVERQGRKTLDELFRIRLPADPANALMSAGQSLAHRVLESREPFLVRDVVWDLLNGEDHPAMEAVGSLVAIPVLAHEHPPMLLVAYTGREAAGALGPEEVRFLSLLGMQAATAMDNAALYRRMADYNEHLEQEVRRRTAEMRAAYEKLKELDRMKDRFLSSISHEMRTPLTGILSTAELLGSMSDPADERTEFISMIRQEAQRLAGMVDEVIQLWVLRQGGARPILDPLDIGQVIEVVMADCRASAQARRVSLAREADSLPGTIMADRYLLRVALGHLVDNAIKFSPAGGAVRLALRSERTAEDAHRLVVSVADQGPGIPEGERHRVLEGFEQVGDLLTAKPPGLGLGLPLVREILGHHGGQLELICPAEGGTIARMTLPASLSEAEPVVAGRRDGEPGRRVGA